MLTHYQGHQKYKFTCECGKSQTGEKNILDYCPFDDLYTWKCPRFFCGIEQCFRKADLEKYEVDSAI